jgi:cyclopropane-fatty-acyl-phospholipid synthase
METMTRFFDRLARSAFMRHGASLRGGRIQFHDELGSWTAGDAETPDALTTHINVHDLRFYRDVARGGTLGAAQSYLQGSWDCDDLTTLFRVLLKDGSFADATDRRFGRLAAPIARLAHRLRSNTRRGSRRNIAAHYDLGNDFFSLFLDSSMTYSCAIFPSRAASLETAQETKIDRVCEKLGLQSGDRVLEIGGGWGSFARRAASRYGCDVTTTTISREQFAFASERVREDGLEGRVHVVLEDYRDLRGRYDKIVSIEMIEAIGHERIGLFLRRISSLLERNGAALVQGITLAEAAYQHYLRSVDFIQKHVFPGSCLLSMDHFARETERAGDLRVEHVEEIGPHYVGTLRAWRTRFRDRLDDVHRLGRGDHLARLWNYYLSYCEAGFRERFLGDVQVLLAKPLWRAGEIAPLPASPW